MEMTDELLKSLSFSVFICEIEFKVSDNNCFLLYTIS